ncbi:MAG: V-type ATPase subunit [Candidatus Baldrarchaeia archaeon]
MIGAEIDAANIKIILRGKLLNLEPSIIKEFLLNVSYRLREDLVQRSLQVKSISEAINALGIHPYGPILQKALKLYEEYRDPAIFEVGLDKFIRS